MGLGAYLRLTSVAFWGGATARQPLANLDYSGLPAADLRSLLYLANLSRREMQDQNRCSAFDCHFFHAHPFSAFSK